MFRPFIRKQILNSWRSASGRCRGAVRPIETKAVAGRFPSGCLWLAAVVMISMTLLPADALSTSMQQSATAQATVADKAPDFVLRDLNGQKFRLSDFRGKKPVLIIFTATWCTFCREEIPHYKSIHAAYVKQGLEIVNIDIQESKEKVAKFSAKYGLPYRILLDEDGMVSGIYDIRGVPSMVLVDSNGHILCRQCQRVESIIESLLKKK